MEEAALAEQPHLLDPVTLLLQLADGEAEAEELNAERRPGFWLLDQEAGVCQSFSNG